MQFRETFDFEHDVETVIRMLGDREYYVRKYERLGGRGPEFVDCEAEGDRFSITVRHALDVSGLAFPDVVRKRFGDRLMLCQTDTWRLSQRQGHVDIKIEKTPADLTIDMSLAERDGDARMSLFFDIQAHVPLFGHKIEKAIAAPITRRMHDDLEVSRQLAADYAVRTS